MTARSAYNMQAALMPAKATAPHSTPVALCRGPQVPIDAITQHGHDPLDMGVQGKSILHPGGHKMAAAGWSRSHTLKVRDEVYWMAKKQDRLTRNDMVKAARKADGAPSRRAPVPGPHACAAARW